MKLTVFTPTYNRAYIIENLYRSLQRQTCFDFEWLVVDDGSADGTEALFGRICAEDNPFPVRYFRKENGGKHSAINFGLDRAEGEYFFIVDSDDTLTGFAVDTVLKLMHSVEICGDNSFAGVCPCKGYSQSKIVGTTFVGDYIDCTALDREKNGISGDKAEVIFTEVMKKYPFPEFEGEKFITECAVWDKMAADGYKLRFTNDIIYLCEYRDDGLTSQGLELYYRNPKGYGYVLRQSRALKKYPKPLSDYFDAECYWHWRRDMSLREIAELIGTKPLELLYISLKYRIKEKASAAKKRVFGQ